MYKLSQPTFLFLAYLETWTFLQQNHIVFENKSDLLDLWVGEGVREGVKTVSIAQIFLTTVLFRFERITCCQITVKGAKFGINQIELDQEKLELQEIHKINECKWSASQDWLWPSLVSEERSKKLELCRWVSLWQCVSITIQPLWTKGNIIYKVD